MVLEKKAETGKAVGQKIHLVETVPIIKPRSDPIEWNEVIIDEDNVNNNKKNN